MRLAVVKSNIAAIPPALDFEVGGDGVRWMPAAPIVEKQTAADRAAGFLTEALARRPKPFCEIMESASAVGVSKRGLYEAKERLGIVNLPNPNGPRKPLWSLPHTSGTRPSGQ
jgi:hypothetical protein